jgi:hypothetical protein
MYCVMLKIEYSEYTPKIYKFWTKVHSSLNFKRLSQKSFNRREHRVFRKVRKE